MFDRFKRLFLGIALIAVASGILLYSDLRNRNRSQQRHGQPAEGAKQFRVALIQHASQVVLDDGVRGVIEALAARGLAVVLSTHDPDHAFSVGNRVALLDDGRLVAQGLPAEVLTPERLRAVYGVSVVVERLRQGQTVCAPDYGEPHPPP